jgi:hypothetical protein
LIPESAQFSLSSLSSVLCDTIIARLARFPIKLHHDPLAAVLRTFANSLIIIGS